VKPAPFEYFVPETVEETLSLLGQYGDEAKILAGGQSLVPMMNFRLVMPACLIDINRLEKLSYIERSDGSLRIGALTRHRMVERSALIRDTQPLALEAVRLIGHPAIRVRGTVGGSVAHADPTAELPAVLAAMDGRVEATGPQGKRSIPWQEFFISYFTTALEPEEICSEIVIPVLPPGAGWAFEEFTQRHGDFAMAGVAAVVAIDEQHRCTLARIAVAGAGPVPVRGTGAEDFLRGEILSDGTIKQAGRLAADQVEPDADLHASEAFRRQLVGVMATRALKRAYNRAEAAIRRERDA
jgi:CO/xanthine dehydrogenase FAD-binding subunit